MIRNTIKYIVSLILIFLISWLFISTIDKLNELENKNKLKYTIIYVNEKSFDTNDISYNDYNKTIRFVSEGYTYTVPVCNIIVRENN